MCDNKRFTKYQREVKNFLEDYLGYQYPFYLEKTEKNHLKIMIQGIEPIFTGSTPSDTNSIKNCKSEVKRLIREHEKNHTDIEREELMFKPNPKGLQIDAMIMKCIRNIKSRLGAIKAKEQALVDDMQDVNAIKPYREQVVKDAISYFLKKQKKQTYVMPSEIKKITNALMEHLNFIMPSVAYYADKLKSEQQNTTEKLSIISIDPIKANKVNNDMIHDEIVEEETEEMAFSYKSSKKTRTKGKHAIANKQNNATKETHVVKPNFDGEPSLPSATNVCSSEHMIDLAAINRVEQLRKLDNEQALALIADIQHAMRENQEEQTATILRLMTKHGITLDDIKAKMAA